MEYLERMKTELKELNEKIKALGTFIYSNDLFRSLEEVQRELMKIQLGYMEEYSDVLTSRIEIEMEME